VSEDDTDLDWYGRTVSGQSYDGVELVDVDMTEVVDEGSTFTDCTFRLVLFNASVHTSAAFTNCTFSRCTFFDTRFVSCKLVGSTFTNCTFGPLTVEGGDWSYVGLAGADLRAATVRGVRLREADLTGARFDDGTLADCDLTGASTRATSLVGCDLRGSDLSTIDPATVDLRGAIVGWQQAVQLATSLGLDVRPD
jgi:uncharacterized protein YjbI with pentapeptide repeats